MENSIVPTAEKPEIVKQEPLSAYIRRPEVIEKFALVLGNDATVKRYIQSVILLVETAEPGEYSLQNCSHRSIVRAALRAATQRVSVDPAEREAYLIPSKNTRIVEGKEVKVLEANFRFHYQEIENRAWRTNLYTHINVSPIYEGTIIKVNPYTGMHTVTLDGGLEINVQSAGVAAGWGREDNKKRIGWLGYFRTRYGREKTIYMTIADIEKNVLSGKGASLDSPAWKKHRELMERKTVLLALLKTADLKAPEMARLKDALDNIDEAEAQEADSGPDLASLSEHDENAPLEGEIKDIPAEKPAEITPEEAAFIQACEVEASDGTKYGTKPTDFLKNVTTSTAPDEKKRAAQIIIDYRKAKEAKKQAELGIY